MTDVLVQPFYASKNVTRIQPGPVGPVGDVLCQTRLKHSNPDLPLRWEAWNSGPNEVFLGSNVQDGYYASYVSCGGPARTYESGNKRTSTRLGTRTQDLNSNTNTMEPKLGSLGDYDWRNKQAVLDDSMRTGFKFLPLPYGYHLPPGEQPRAGSYTRVVAGEYPTDTQNPIFGRPPVVNPPGQPGTGGGNKRGPTCRMPLFTPGRYSKPVN